MWNRVDEGWGSAIQTRLTSAAFEFLGSVIFKKMTSIRTAQSAGDLFPSGIVAGS